MYRFFISCRKWENVICFYAALKMLVGKPSNASWANTMIFLGPVEVRSNSDPKMTQDMHVIHH
jgi:hypothetical protein